MSSPKKRKMSTENKSSKTLGMKNTNESTNNCITINKKKKTVDKKNANLIILSSTNTFLIDYRNPSIWIKSFADPKNIGKKQNLYKVNRVRIQEDYYTTFVKTIKENEWECVFNSLTTRFSYTLLAPTIIIRFIIHFILITNDPDLLERAIAAISSYFQAHQSILKYKKKYYEKLLLEPENDKDCPKIVGGKLFNSILDEVLHAILENANDEKTCDVTYKAPDYSEDGAKEEASYCAPPTLTPENHLERIMIVFGLFLDFLETDFIEFLVKYREEPKKSILIKSRQPLIVKIDSPDLERLLKTLNYCGTEERSKIIRYINLLAEVIRVSDLDEEDREKAARVLNYPHFGKQCIQFASKVTHFFISSEYGLKKAVQMLGMFPTWLQMYVYSEWITERLGVKANPSLTFVVHLLKLCLKETQKTSNPVKSQLNLKAQKKLLSKHKLSPNSIHRRNPLGETKLIQMCHKKKFDLVEAILSLPDVDVNAVCNAGWSALHEAVLRGSKEMVSMLLQYKPTVPNLKPTNVYISNAKGETALHSAALTGNLEICQLLVQKGGARLIEMEASNGKKPIDYTKSKEVRDYFLKTLEKNKDIFPLRTDIFLDLDLFDLVLLRELTFAVIGVYSLNEILRQCLNNSQNTGISEENRYSSNEVRLKLDFKIIKYNIKALRDLQFILKCLAEQHVQPERLLKDWLNCII